jgi:hypothetical protein
LGDELFAGELLADELLGVPTSSSPCDPGNGGIPRTARHSFLVRTWAARSFYNCRSSNSVSSMVSDSISTVRPVPN